MLLFSGTASPNLARTIATALNTTLSKAVVTTFADGESKIIIQENVRGKDVAIIQSTSPPVNHNLIELCLMAAALRRKGAKSITAVVPYCGYARQDYAATKTATPHSLAVIAQMLNAVGIDRLITCDLHTAKSTALFKFPVINLSNLNIFLPNILQQKFINPVIIAPDLGAVKRAEAYSQSLQTKIAIIAKQREKGQTTAAISLMGSVAECDCIVVDDIIDTGNTIYTAINVLKAHGAARIYVYCTHGVFSGNTLQWFLGLDLQCCTVSNSIELQSYNVMHNKLKQISIANLIIKFL